jgi:4-alpha-glucanotransferase
MELDPSVRRLAEAHGIALDWWDWQGVHTEVPSTTIVATLAAMGVDASSPEAAQQALAAAEEQRWARMVPACVVTREGGWPAVDVHVAHGHPAMVWIELEAGGTHLGVRQEDNWNGPRYVGGEFMGEATFRIPGDLPLGYHTLHARSDDREATCALIVTPNWLGFPTRMGAARTWGLATQIYSVRSAQSWGVGDAVDLADLGVWAAADQGAGFVLVNPLHAAEPVAPLEPSPYLPTSRRFVNPMYLRPERIPEFADVDEQGRAVIAAAREGLIARLHGLDAIDRDASWTAKRGALQVIHRAPRSAGRDLAYRAYCRREGRSLRDFATWSAIAEQHGPDWHEWPEELRHPDSPQVAIFRDEHAEVIDFHCWLQWLADEQLNLAQDAITSAGAVLGVMHDLAVGVKPGGADAWALQEVYAQGVYVGAPPDAFNQNGQDWQQPPWRPDRLAEVAYAPFRDMVRTVLRHAGGIRVDHIIGLFRLWWIPIGAAPTAGTYVRFDHEAMIGILALEAYRARALVVGEDLGTVEPWVRTYLRDRGILGTSILWFEFEHDLDGAPLRPEWWREYCLASVTTHDLPPTAGYLAGDHVRLRHQLGLLTRPLEEELAADETERTAWLDNLRRREALTSDADTETIVLALHRYLTWTPSRLLCAALTDAIGDRRTQNQPGTIDEYPNWRVPLSDRDGDPISLELVFTAAQAARLAAVMRGE